MLSQRLLAPAFLEFFGLNEQPFGVTPDPAYIYPSRMHSEALASLKQGIHNLRGFMTLIAEPGMGKTTLLNKLMEELRIPHASCSFSRRSAIPAELLGYLLGELGVESPGMDLPAMHRMLNEILFREMMQGRRFVLIMDEAQNLDESTLETIRLLSDFETSNSKLIQIVLGRTAAVGRYAQATQPFPIAPAHRRSFQTGAAQRRRNRELRASTACAPPAQAANRFSRTKLWL